MRRVPKPFPLLLPTAVLAALPSGCATPPRAAGEPCTQVAFLIGCWRSVDGDRVTEEVWTPPHGDTMYGQNRTLRGGELRAFELLTIEPRGADLVYVARPQGGAPTEFRLVAHAPGDATFANPEHDFPKRIRYRRLADGALEATVDDGTDGGQRLTFRWLPVR